MHGREDDDPWGPDRERSVSPDFWYGLEKHPGNDIARVDARLPHICLNDFLSHYVGEKSGIVSIDF